MWGLSTISAKKLQFEVEDEISGLAIKTTVVEYFKSRYQLVLRYMISSLNLVVRVVWNSHLILAEFGLYFGDFGRKMRVKQVLSAYLCFNPRF